MVFIAEPTVNEPIERFLTERPMLPRGLADHVTAVKVSRARIGERLGLVGSRLDTHSVSERVKHVAPPVLDISFNNDYYNNRLLKERKLLFYSQRL